MLIDLVFPNYETLTIAYPEDGISCRERKESIKVEPDMFSMFDLAQFIFLDSRAAARSS